MSKDLLQRLDEVANDLAESAAKRIRKLQDEVDFLNCLHAAGVDNWEGYEDAQDAYNEQR